MNGMTVPGASKAQPITNTANTQGANIKQQTIQINKCYMTITDASSGYHKKT